MNTLIRVLQPRLLSLSIKGLFKILMIILVAYNAALAQSSSDPETPQGWQLDDSFRSVGALRYLSPDNSMRVELSAKPATQLSAAEWLDNYAVEFASGSELVSVTPAKVDENIITASKAYRGNDKAVDAVWLEVMTKTSSGLEKNTVLAAVVRADEPVQLAVVSVLQPSERVSEYLRIAEVLAAQSAMQPIDLNALLESQPETPTTDKADAAKEVGAVLGVDLDELARKIRQEVDAELAAEAKKKAKAANSEGNTQSARSSPASKAGKSKGSNTPRTGQLVVGRVLNNTLMRLDLRTGQHERFPSIDDLSATGALRGRARVYTRRDRSVESGLLLTVDFCTEENPDVTCFLFLDRDGNRIGQFAMNGRDSGPGKASFDGTHVAVNRSDRAAGLSVMSIFTREGKFLSSHAQSSPMHRAGPYDWLPDGRLVYSMEGNPLLGDAQPTGFIITDPFDTTPRRRITLPDFYQNDGRILSIDTSPDGQQLLMLVAPRVGPRRPILVDVKTQKITQLIDRSTSNIEVNYVNWGPGGRWVYAAISQHKLLSGPSLDNSQGNTVAFVGSFQSLYAFEVNGTTHPLPESASDLSNSVQLIQTDDVKKPGSPVRQGRFKGGLTWIP